ncbi:Hypothetical predicted protein [Cloeon dipterum]|uniref:Uncharacterized protein n=1 Tax=Cloeon dipterum TaxID=197152 RepID=A0A8S1CQM2_9INSE|nr:Hypothetical predicted protein [Cloeon dipterum]
MMAQQSAGSTKGLAGRRAFLPLRSPHERKGGRSESRNSISTEKSSVEQNGVIDTQHTSRSSLSGDHRPLSGRPLSDDTLTNPTLRPPAIGRSCRSPSFASDRLRSPSVRLLCFAGRDFAVLGTRRSDTPRTSRPRRPDIPDRLGSLGCADARSVDAVGRWDRRKSQLDSPRSADLDHKYEVQLKSIPVDILAFSCHGFNTNQNLPWQGHGVGDDILAPADAAVVISFGLN